MSFWHWLTIEAEAAEAVLAVTILALLAHDHRGGRQIPTTCSTSDRRHPRLFTTVSSGNARLLRKPRRLMGGR